MTRTIWIQLIGTLALGAALIVDHHIISVQDAKLRVLTADLAASAATMTRANQPLHAQGYALEECVKSVYPRLSEPPVRREGERL